jgi:hypothetical protein
MTTLEIILSIVLWLIYSIYSINKLEAETGEAIALLVFAPIIGVVKAVIGAILYLLHIDNN